MNNNFKIEKCEVSNLNSCFIIAEVAQAHDGSLGMAHSYIDAVVESGANAIKFQTHIAEAESTLDEPFRVQFSYEDASRYDYWKRMEFTEEQWNGLKEHCKDKNIIFLSSPFSVEAVHLLERVGMPAWKVGSGEVNNPLILNAMIKTGNPILLSSGMSGWNEIDTAVNSFEEAKIKYALFQCTSKYPTSLKEIGLNVINEMKSKYDVPIGLSDHSGVIYPSIAAIANGCNLLEVHVAFDKKMFGPDTQSSLTLKQLTEIVDFRNACYEMYENPVDKDQFAESLKDMRLLFNKSVVLKKGLQEGSVIQKNNLTIKKPGTGIAPDRIEEIIGKVLTTNLLDNHILKWSDLDN